MTNQQHAFTPDIQLILYLALGKFTEEIQDKARTLLGQNPDWSRILGWVREQRVFPLVYRNLRTLGFPAVPGEVRMSLQADFRRNALRNTLILRELKQVLRLLGDARVSVIPLKGVALADSLYGDASLRLCLDTDILVPRDQVSQAISILFSSGYKERDEGRTFSDFLLRNDFEYHLTRDESGFQHVIELHWGILPKWLIDEKAMEELWKEARNGEFFGTPAYRLNPEWELLLLVAHISRHRWQGLKWLIDIHDLCASPELDWERLWAKAKRLRMKDLLDLTLGACHRLFNTPIPNKQELRALPRWFKLFPAEPTPLDALKAALFPIRSFHRLSGKLGYLAHTLFTPQVAEHGLVRFPAGLRYLYFLVRPLRIGSKWGWRLLRHGMRRLVLTFFIMSIVYGPL